MAEAIDGSFRSGVCAWCEQPFTVPRRRGPAPRYCRPAHRQAAYAARRARSRPAKERPLPQVGRRPFDLLYGDLGPDEAGRLMARFRAWLFARSLAEATVDAYLRLAWSAEAYCAEHGGALAVASGRDVADWMGRLAPSARKQAGTALRHYWRCVHRPGPPLAELRAAVATGSRPGTPDRPRPGPARPDALGPDARERLSRVRVHMLQRNLAPRSVAAYLRVLATAEVWCATRGTSLLEVDADALEPLARAWASSSSARRQLQVALKHYWGALGRLDGPCWVVFVPPKARGSCRALEGPEAARLAARARQRADAPGAAVMLGLFNGLRREEIAHLRWEDVGSDGWVTVVGKGSLRARIPLHPACAEALGWLERSGAWVFPGRFPDRAVSVATVWTWVRQVGEEAGLVDLAPHRLRHTALATANDHTGDLRAVQELALQQALVVVAWADSLVVAGV